MIIRFTGKRAIEMDLASCTGTQDQRCSSLYRYAPSEQSGGQRKPSVTDDGGLFTPHWKGKFLYETRRQKRFPPGLD